MPTPLYELKAEFFRTLGHPGRIRVLELLTETPEMPVRDLQRGVGLESSHLSQQLAVLRRAGLVTTRKDGNSVYYTSDATAEFLQLQKMDLSSGRSTSISGKLDWDVEAFELSPDARHLVYVANEDGISTIHLLDLASGKELALPPLPAGVIDTPSFSPDGSHLAFTLTSATSPSTSPGPTGAWVCSARNAVANRQPSAAAATASRSSGSRTRLVSAAGTATSSAHEPG